MRRRFPYLLFALLMGFDVTVFLLQKLASDHAASPARSYLVSIAMHPWVWLSLALTPVQLLTWTRILARTDISFAFPLTSLSVPLTMLASALVLGERPSPQVCLGALLITIGAAILKPAPTQTVEGVDGQVVAGV